jgi:hypothetical protein
VALTPIRLHPGLSAVYSRRVGALTDALNDDATRDEAAALLRAQLSDSFLFDQLADKPMNTQRVSP